MRKILTFFKRLFKKNYPEEFSVSGQTKRGREKWIKDMKRWCKRNNREILKIVRRSRKGVYFVRMDVKK